MTQIIVTAEKSDAGDHLCTYVKGVLFCCSRMANAYFTGTVRLKNHELRHNIKPRLFIYAKNEYLKCNDKPTKFILDKCNFCGEEIRVCAIDPHWEPIPVRTYKKSMREIGPREPFTVEALDEKDICDIENDS